MPLPKGLAAGQEAACRLPAPSHLSRLLYNFVGEIPWGCSLGHYLMSPGLLQGHTEEGNRACQPLSAEAHVS